MDRMHSTLQDTWQAVEAIAENSMELGHTILRSITARVELDCLPTSAHPAACPLHVNSWHLSSLLNLCPCKRCNLKEETW